jgi:CheY-like chemotaxis protein
VLDEGEDSGFELLQWIRHHHPGLPVIVLSAAQVNSASIRKAYELGASSYFVKGNVPMAHIYSDLAARLVERGTGRPGSYRFGRLEFDPTHRTVKFGKGEIQLTQQQTALVLHLAQGSKSATARDLIEAGLFRSNAAHSTVHSALLTLRRRLDELEPGLRVALHYRPLFWRKRAGFVQHFGGHNYLADVVEQRAEPEPEQRPGIHPHAVRENTREESHALAVALGVVVLALDRVPPVMCHLEEAGLEGRVSPFHLSDAMLRLEARVQCVRLV